jgi:hypothetical protein
MKNTRTYFLNIFHILGSEHDIVKQDLPTHGLSLFDHFDVKYVTLHKKLPTYSGFLEKTINQVFVPEIRQIMSEILSEDNPVYEDDRILVYKIPKPNSVEPFLLLGSGWYPFQPEHNARATMENSEILIVNPTDSEINITLDLVLSSIENRKIMTFSLNGEKIDTISIPTMARNIQLGNLILKPGINVVALDADRGITVQESVTLDAERIDNKLTKFLLSKEMQVSFKVESISIIN